jgi:hypothetical protein
MGFATNSFVRDGKMKAAEAMGHPLAALELVSLPGSTFS